MLPVIRSAHLRVYMPIDRVGAFHSHVDAGRGMVRASDHFVWTGPMGDDAFAVDWAGQRYVCPRYPRLRMLEGVLSFREDHPGSALMSELAVRWASQELSRIRAQSPTARSYILSSPWHVPLRWYACFDPGDRELYDGADGTSIRYRTDLADALVRLERAIGILEEAGFEDAIVAEVGELEHWLREFSTHAMLELDYGAVAGLFSDGALALDESAADVHRSLDALERLDYEEAGIAYAEVAGRWAPAQALAYVN